MNYETELSIIKKSPRKIEGENALQVIKACAYLSMVIEKSNLTAPYTGVVLRHHKALERCGIDGTRPYSTVINRLERLGIITVCDETYYCDFSGRHPEDNKARTYNIDMSRFQELFIRALKVSAVWHTGVVNSYITYINQVLNNGGDDEKKFNIQFKNVGEDRANSVKLLAEIDLLVPKYMLLIQDETDELPVEFKSGVEKRHAALFEEIKQIDAQHISTFYLNGEEMSAYDERFIRKAFVNKYVNENILILQIQEMIDKINARLPENEQFRFKVTCRIKNDAMWIKGRLVNPIAIMHKRDVVNRQTGEIQFGRNSVNARDGYDLNFDLHSEIFAIARAMNGLGFDIDDDMKTDCQKALGLTRAFIKKHGMYSFFGGKPNEAIHEFIQNWTGGTTEYVRSIWFYEALIILYVYEAMLNKGFAVRNAYDCYYFKGIETTEADVKQIITDAVNRIVNEFTVVAVTDGDGNPAIADDGDNNPTVVDDNPFDDDSEPWDGVLRYPDGTVAPEWKAPQPQQSMRGVCVNLSNLNDVRPDRDAFWQPYDGNRYNHKYLF